MKYDVTWQLLQYIRKFYVIPQLYLQLNTKINYKVLINNISLVRILVLESCSVCCLFLEVVSVTCINFSDIKVVEKASHKFELAKFYLSKKEGKIK